MIKTINLPDIGEGLVDGEVVEWIKNVGDKVVKNKPVVIIMTDKTTVEMTSSNNGIMKKHYYNAGELAKVNQPLYDIEIAENE